MRYCDQDWEVLGRGGGYESIPKAKASAERAYHGVSSRWIDNKVSEAEALNFRDEMWASQRCSFCDKTPLDGIDRIIARNDVRICDRCITEFQRVLREDPQSSG